jgi:hypothetical protein
MTNTTVPQTVTGVTCVKCSTGFGKDRKVVKHANVDAVRACYFAPVQPVVEVPAPAPAPEPKSFQRYAAKCPKKGCKTSAVKNEQFSLKCSNHGKPVYVMAKQLTGTYSTSEKHRCDPRCTGAVGHVCVCQCGGVNHGIDLLVKIV